MARTRQFGVALALVCASFVPPRLDAQQRVPQEFQHERIMVIVPMIGTGKVGDPIRPMFTPLPSSATPATQPTRAAQEVAPVQPKFLSMQYELSDDGKTALVEFVAKDRSAFKEILDYQGTDVKKFEPGKNTKDDVEREFKKVKPLYTFDKSSVGGAK
jgi:hypothetical protein